MSWSFATVAGSAWALNIPYRSITETCDNEAFHYQILPSGGCLYAYYFSLVLFAVVAVPLTLIDLKEQTALQLVVGILRFLVLGFIVTYCIVRLYGGGDACQEELQMNNSTKEINVNVTYMSKKFNVMGWMESVPVITNAFLFHAGIPSLLHPIEQKRYLHWLLVSVCATALVVYMGVGIVIPLWFRAATQETSTHIWVRKLSIFYAHRYRIVW